MYQNQTTTPTSTLEPKKKANLSLFANIVLIIVILALGGYIIFDKISQPNNKTDDKGSNQQTSDKKESDKETDPAKTYDASHYITISQIDTCYNTVNCQWSGIVNKIEFKNLPIRTTTEFLDKHEDFIYPNFSSGYGFTASNQVSYEVAGNIFSVLDEEKKVWKDGLGDEYYDIISLNIDLSTEKIVTNQELLDKYNIKTADMYKKILTKIADSVSIDEFLLDTHGNVAADKISVTEFRKNIDTYAGYIDNRADMVTMFFKDGKLCASFAQSAILNILGMGSHMGIGLKAEPQIVQLN